MLKTRPVKKMINQILMFVAFVLVVSGFNPVSARADYEPARLNIAINEKVDGDELYGTESFDVTLTALEDSPMPAGSVNGVKTIAATPGNKNTFGEMIFTNPGIFKYTITQSTGKTDGMEYDSTVYDVIASVTNETLEGGVTKLVVHMYVVDHDTQQKVGSGTNDAVIDAPFINTYSNPAFNNKKGDLTISKKVTGNPKETETFRFTIAFSGSGADGKYEYSNMAGRAEGTMKNGSMFALSGGEKLTIHNMPEGLEYTITEDQSPFYTPDPINGVISGKIIEGQNIAAFTNHYDSKLPAPVTIDPPVEKRISGGKPSHKSVFTFAMEADNGSNPMPEGSKDGYKEVQISGEGSVEIGYITYTVPGRYEYKVYEKAGDAAGYIYDETIFTMVVTVTSNDGKLSAVRVIYREDGSKVSNLTFTNEYKDSAETTTKNDSENVQTGDSNKLWLLWLLLGVAAAAVVVLGIVSQKKKK